MTLVGLLGVLVLSLSSEFKIRGCLFGTEAHTDFVERVCQAVVGDDVVEFLVAIAEALPSLSGRCGTLRRMNGARDMLSKPPVRTS
jgi:hypothetical protein